MIARSRSFSPLLIPALFVMLVSGVVPAGFVAYYSVHDTFAGNSFVWVGPQWYVSVLSSPEFWWALARSLGFSALVLLVEVPLGIWIALRLPPSGALANILIVLLAIPLLAPQIVVGYLWKVLTTPGIGLLHALFAGLGLEYDMNNPVVVWATLLLMDAWHWTSLVVLLCYAGLRAIPQAYYQAARIDGAGAWAVFRHIQRGNRWNGGSAAAGPARPRTRRSSTAMSGQSASQAMMPKPWRLTSRRVMAARAR